MNSVAEIAKNHNFERVVNFTTPAAAIRCAQSLKFLGWGIVIIPVTDTNVNVATNAPAAAINSVRLAHNI